MVSQTDLDKALETVRSWERIVQKQFDEYQAKSGWFSGKAGEKSEWEAAVKSFDAAKASYNNMVAIFNNQGSVQAKNEFYKSQVLEAGGSNTIYYLVAVVVVAVLGFIVYKKFKK